MTHDFGALWKHQGFFTSSRDKIKNGLYAQELLDVMILLATLSIIKVVEHSKLDSLEAKRKLPH